MSETEQRRRIVLTPELALEIYGHKVNLQKRRGYGPLFDVSRLLRGQSTVVAVKYNVSAKTIRDIWNRKTWTFATCILWEHGNKHPTMSSDRVI